VNDSRGSLVNHRRLSAASFAAVALALALVGAACSSALEPTPSPVADTPTPAATTQASATATTAPQSSLVATFTPWPTVPPTAPPTPYHTPGKTAAPSAGPTSPAQACSSSAKNQTFFLEAANALKFTVYCASPKGWSLANANYGQPKAGGWLTINYKSGSATIAVSEGAFCLTSASACAPKSSSIGSASFGPLSGALDGLASGDLAIYVSPGTAHAYRIVGHLVSQSAFVSIAAGFKAVPKT
jgi:hypothetical protein